MNRRGTSRSGCRDKVRNPRRSIGVDFRFSIFLQEVFSIKPVYKSNLRYSVYLPHADTSLF